MKHTENLLMHSEKEFYPLKKIVLLNSQSTLLTQLNFLDKSNKYFKFIESN